MLLSCLLFLFIKESTAEAKVCLKVRDDKELMSFYSKAQAANLPAYLIVDAGRTQIPSGSKTVVAIGPAPVPLIDQVTGNLKLL